MKAPLRAVVMAAVVAASLALHAQEDCPPPAQPNLQWTGLTSGCTAENAVPCETGETIVFTVAPEGGGSYPACVTYLWNFGDDTESTEASPSHVYAIDGSFFVSVRVRGGDVDVFDGAPMIVALTVLPIIDLFTASATSVRRGQRVTLTWATRNANSVRIEPLGMDLPATETSYQFTPVITRTYRLTAFGAAGVRVSQPVTITVTGLGRRRVVRH